MKFRLIVLLTTLIAFGVVSSYGCYPGQRGAYTVKNKKEKKGYLGVNLQDVTRRLAEKKDLVTTSGAYVTSVVDNSPAEDAGIKKGDVIVKFNGKEVDDSDELTDLVRDTKPGTTVDVVVERKRETKTLKAELERFDEPRAFSFNFDDDFDITVPDPPRAAVRPRVQVYTTGSSMYGLSVQTLNKQLAEYFEVPGKKGVLVSEVKKNSDAEKAGFKAGDVVTKVGSTTIWDANDLREEIQDAEEGDELSFEVFRKGKSSTLKLKIEDADDDWSFYVPNGSGYHYHFKDKLDKDIRENALGEVEREMKESMKEVKKELKKAKDSLRRELLRM